MIRPMQPDDLPGVAALAQHRRQQYEVYQPQFWRVADNAVQVHRPFIEQLMNDDAVVSLVAVEADAVAGFVIGRVVPAPPVYDPGGPAGFVDDFVVADSTLWLTLGRRLLKRAAEQLKELGAVQIVVVCGHRDTEKREALYACGLTVVSEWLVGPAEEVATAARDA